MYAFYPGSKIIVVHHCVFRVIVVLAPCCLRFFTVHATTMKLVQNLTKYGTLAGVD